jgi:hypothetical protein
MRLSNFLTIYLGVVMTKADKLYVTVMLTCFIMLLCLVVGGCSSAPTRQEQCNARGLHCAAERPTCYYSGDCGAEGNYHFFR